MFQLVICGVIVLNALVIGFSSDQSVKDALERFDEESSGDASVASWLFALDIFFNTVYLIELIMRFLAQEGEFLVGVDWRCGFFASSHPLVPAHPRSALILPSPPLRFRTTDKTTV